MSLRKPSSSSSSSARRTTSSAQQADTLPPPPPYTEIASSSSNTGAGPSVSSLSSGGRRVSSSTSPSAANVGPPSAGVPSSGRSRRDREREQERSGGRNSLGGAVPVGGALMGSSNGIGSMTSNSDTSRRRYDPPPGPPPPMSAPPPSRSQGSQVRGSRAMPVPGGSESSSRALPSPPHSPASAYSAPRAPAPRTSAATEEGLIQRMASLRTSGSAAAGRSTRGREDPLDFLAKYDTIFLVDDSSSMEVNERKDGTMGKSRWEEARDALAGMVELAAKYDDDGIDVHFLNNEQSLEGCRDPEEIKDLFDSVRPNGITPTGERLEMLLLEYLDAIEDWKAGKRAAKATEPKKRNIIVITDGAASDDPESVLVAVARRLDNGRFPLSQIGVQFFQVGDDEEATEMLVGLDDSLTGVRDIVDTVTYEGVALNPASITKALLGSINRRLDKQASHEVK